MLWKVHIFFHINCNIGRAMLPSQLFNSDLKTTKIIAELINHANRPGQ